MITKRLVCTHRLRRIPKRFSWIDQRLVREKHISALSCQSCALYLFLVTVADAEGLSYYSESSILKYLPFDSASLENARKELCATGLIAYRYPFYQVLSLMDDGYEPLKIRTSSLKYPKKT